VVEEVSPLQPINMKNDSINTVNEKKLERMPFGTVLYLKIDISLIINLLGFFNRLFSIL
jgi:hypothetical protein